MRKLDRYRYVIAAALALGIVLVALLGPSAGLRGEDLREVLSGQGAVSIVIAFLLRAPGGALPSTERDESEDP